MRQVKLYGTTDGTAGTLTITYGHKVVGLLQAVEWIDGDFADGVDAVISVDRDDDAADVTLLTLTNANDDAWYYPRVTTDSSDGTEITTKFVSPVVSGKLKLAVTSGGSVKTGGCIVYVEE